MRELEWDVDWSRLASSKGIDGLIEGTVVDTAGDLAPEVDMPLRRVGLALIVEGKLGVDGLEGLVQALATKEPDIEVIE